MGGIGMARRKGQKCWEGIGREGWLSLFGNTVIMTDLMMSIFDCLYHSPDLTDNAKHIAQVLQMEYRALNAAVGWAGNKIKALCEEERQHLQQEGKDCHCILTEEGQLTSCKEMAPWEYVFDGIEDEDGTYLWIMKPAAAIAFKELEDGTFEILKDNKIIAKADAKGETLTYLYSTGEKLMTSNSVSGDTEIFFKNGVTFFKGDTESAKWFYKNGKMFYEFYKNLWRFFDAEGNQIISNFDNITDIKKIN